MSNIDILSVTIDGTGFTDADLVEVGGITFEYDTSGIPPTNGNVVIDVLGSDTTADIAAKTATAITSQGILGVTAIANGSDVLILPRKAQPLTLIMRSALMLRINEPTLPMVKHSQSQVMVLPTLLNWIVTIHSSMAIFKLASQRLMVLIPSPQILHRHSLMPIFA